MLSKFWVAGSVADTGHVCFIYASSSDNSLSSISGFLGPWPCNLV